MPPADPDRDTRAPSRRLLTSAEVAARLRRSLDWWYHNKRRLIAQEGFPPPVRGMSRLWDSAAIEAWLDRAAGIGSAQSAPSTPAEDLTGWTARLTGRLADPDRDTRAPSRPAPP